MYAMCWRGRHLSVFAHVRNASGQEQNSDMHRIGVRCGPRSSQRALAAAAQINEGAALSPQAPELGRSGTLGNDRTGRERQPGADAIGLCRIGGFTEPAECPSRGLAMVRNVDALQHCPGAIGGLNFVCLAFSPASLGSFYLFPTHASFCDHHGARPSVILGCSVSRQDLK